MSLHSPTELFTLDDDALREAVTEAHLPSLLTTLAHVLGDESFLDPALKPDCSFVAGPQGGYDEAQEARARDLCLDGLIRLREAGSTAVAELGDARLRRCMGFLIDGEDLDDVLPLLLGDVETLTLDTSDWERPRPKSLNSTTILSRLESNSSPSAWATHRSRLASLPV